MIASIMIIANEKVTSSRWSFCDDREKRKTTVLDIVTGYGRFRNAFNSIIRRAIDTKLIFYNKWIQISNDTTE